jgi:hypothetical protein
MPDNELGGRIDWKNGNTITTLAGLQAYEDAHPEEKTASGE